MASPPVFLAEGSQTAPSPVPAVASLSAMGSGSNRQQSGQKLYCAYGGPSMHPTLAAQDLLEIAPYTACRPAPGDVILCTAPVAHRYVIHRIVAGTPAGFRTRGDNCGNEDPWLLTEREIVGRVVAANRPTGCRPIHGGMPGRFLAAHCHLRRQALVVLTALLRPLFRAIRHGGRKGLPPGCRCQLYRFGNQDRPAYRLMAGPKTIGVYDHAARCWRIRLPYRLFFDASALPPPENHAEPAGLATPAGLADSQASLPS